MIGYHYSPEHNHKSIAKHGLLVPTKHPKLTVPMVCSQGHRNPHISLGANPVDAWMLSGGFLADLFNRGAVGSPCILIWSLYQVDLSGVRYRRLGDELQVRVDIPRRYVRAVGERYWDV